jgi:hypothetical protein
MSELDPILINAQNDEIFLNTIRNGFIFLLVALALLGFGKSFTKYAPFALLISIATLILALVTYWKSGSQRLFGVSVTVTAAIILMSWIFYESLKK